MTEQKSSLLTGLVRWWQQEKRRNGTSNSTDHHQHLQQQRRAPANHPDNNSNGEQTTSTKIRKYYSCWRNSNFSSLAIQDPTNKSQGTRISTAV